MVFSSLVFLCMFLPVVILGYYCLPGKCRNLFLFVASLLFYAWGEPRYCVIMLFSTVFDYTNGRLIAYFQTKEKSGLARAVLILSIVGNLCILGFFKYTDFALTNLNQLFGSSIPLLRLALPIGISFYTFQTMSYTIDVYRGEVKAQKNLIDFGTFVCLFPQLIAGPIVRYKDIASELKGFRVDWNRAYHGLLRFCKGLCKKVICANMIGMLNERIFGLSMLQFGQMITSVDGAMPLVTAWLGAIAFTFQIYYDFSGYSDMAIGIGEMLGFTFPENFNHPYEAKSITEFWRRWHMSLSGWFRDYLYIPLGGNQKGKGRQAFNLLIVWGLTGLWHGAGWNFLFWGLYYFVLLVVEKFLLGKLLNKLPKLVQHLMTLVLIVVGWVIFSIEDLSVLGHYLLSMVGCYGIVDSNSIYELWTHGLLLVLLALFASSLPKRCYLWCKSILKEQIIWAELVMLFVGVALSIVFLCGDSYNPFLYFRF